MDDIRIITQFVQIGCHNRLSGAEILEQLDRIGSLRQGSFLERDDGNVECVQILGQNAIRLLSQQSDIGQGFQRFQVGIKGTPNQHKQPVGTRQRQFPHESSIEPVRNSPVIPNHRLLNTGHFQRSAQGRKAKMLILRAVWEQNTAGIQRSDAFQ